MQTSDRWYQHAVVYCLDVDTFQDSNGDGIGDFAGLSSRLDYLAGLGVTCLWLLPFYPSPNRDNGYDVMDFYGVDPRLGTLGDFVEFSHRAHERGLRLIIDLVINHTSVDHPWFQSARADERSPYRDYYVWSASKPEDHTSGVVFPGYQETVWTYDRKARAYYYHRFYEHQPDLNTANPAVREEIKKIMGFWLQLGVSGFRMDAAPFVVELKGLDEADPVSPFTYLREFRDFLSWRRGDAIFLAEANVATDKLLDYFGDGDRLQMLFNFWVNQHTFLALARQSAAPLVQGLLLPPELPRFAQWGSFLRNHDEIDLGRLSERERQEVFAAFGPEPTMQLYDRGIRRRFAAMLGGELPRLKMAYSLMFALPGTPVIWYGDEIGMGDDLSLPERNSVRTPMQWTPEANGGFSTAKRQALIRPVIDKGDFGYPRVNVELQSLDPQSLLSFLERLIRVRLQCPEIGAGQWKLVDAGEPSVLALCCTKDNGVVITVHNLGASPCRVTLDIGEHEASHLIDLLGDRRYEVMQQQTHAVELEGYGFRWFRVARSVQPAGRAG